MKFSTQTLKEAPVIVALDDSSPWCKHAIEEAYRGIHKGGSLPLSGKIILQKTLSQVDLSGQVDFAISAECDRCLDPFPLSIHIPLRLTFIPKAQESAKDEEGDSETEGLNAWTYSAEEIDLEDVIYEHAALSIPVQFLCHETCRGLCPQCGKNRNREACTCEDKAAVDSRLAALAQWTQKRP